jgi:bisphosphoglycerate-independent phosphoglycerate mutase (AlkP superfamily)
MRRGKKVMIIILDGWGEQIPDEYNGIHVALTPTMDALKKVVFGCPCSSVKIAPYSRNASTWRFSVVQSDIG